jgi:hypothetical protein
VGVLLEARADPLAAASARRLVAAVEAGAAA